MKILKILLFLISFTTMMASEFDKGVQNFKDERYVEAKYNFENYIKTTPTQDKNYYKSIEYLGDIAGHQKNWDEAQDKYEILKNKFPTNADYFYKFGGAMGMKAKEVNKFRAMGMIDEVENAFLTAAKLDAKHVGSRWALVMFYLEIPGILGGSETKAKKYAEELTKISPVDGHLANGYISEYFKRYKQAEQSYLKADSIGKSQTTYQKLYNLYASKLKDKNKASKLKEQYQNK
jgi:tetratricopeptide (TPR) repeat protein